MSETLILASTNPQYDDRLFTELPVQYMKIASSKHAQNNLSSYCGLVDAKIRASDKDLPVSNINILNKYLLVEFEPHLRYR